MAGSASTPIHNEGRQALADRVWRLKSGLSPASNPLRRTAHSTSNILVEPTLPDELTSVTASFAVHHYDPKRQAASTEVIVSSGAIGSPQLLELSGVGQAQRLKDLGIDVVHDLPGVGENLHDRFSCARRLGTDQADFDE